MRIKSYSFASLNHWQRKQTLFFLGGGSICKKLNTIKSRSAEIINLPPEPSHLMVGSLKACCVYHLMCNGRSGNGRITLCVSPDV